MSKKHRGGPAPVPPANQTQKGPIHPTKQSAPTEAEGAGFSQQEPNRRLGNYETEGEHALEQPDGKQGPNMK
jgi:hypothetical protein